MSDRGVDTAPPLATKLVTERLVLRPPRTSDVGRIRAAYRDNAEGLRPYLPLPAPGVDPHSVTEITARVLQHRRQWREASAFVFYLALRDGLDDVIGRVALAPIFWGPMRNATLGYWMDERQRGRGLMTEAVGAALTFAFETLALHRVEAGIMPRNAKSHGVVQRLAFRREGLCERSIQIAGVWEDHVLYAITREEWPTAGAPRGPA